MSTYPTYTIAIDFDGVVVSNAYPEIGDERKSAIVTLRLLVREGHRLILWTTRRGTLLDEAVAWFVHNDIPLYAVNSDFVEQEGNFQVGASNRKLKVDIFIDGRMIGGVPSWQVIYNAISQGTPFRRIIDNDRLYTPPEPLEIPKKKTLFQRLFGNKRR